MCPSVLFPPSPLYLAIAATTTPYLILVAVYGSFARIETEWIPVRHFQKMRE